VFIGGFILMVIEVIGARYLPRYFGSSFNVWVSQIGVVMIALAAGYYIGGSLADRWQKARYLSFLLIPAGVMIWFVPNFGAPIMDAILRRHPMGVAIPLLWQKLDPVIGSALVFLIPCVVLAMMSPYMIRLITSSVAQVGRSSGAVIAASTLGSIFGVFISGFVLIDNMKIPSIFQLMGATTIVLALLCVGFDWLTPPKTETPQHKEKVQL
jgi:hypothetical protein